ncbi:MAG: hypothetical protein Q9160_001416 [Pyrenula sp. 1 TL-2023]
MGGDWEVHRQEITSLYLDKQFSLRSVKQWMDHNQRQYKTRFAHWGVKKRPTKAVPVQHRSPIMKRKRQEGALPPQSFVQGSTSGSVEDHSKRRKSTPELYDPAAPSSRVLVPEQSPRDDSSTSSNDEPMESSTFETQSSVTSVSEALQNVGAGMTCSSSSAASQRIEEVGDSDYVPLRVDVANSEGQGSFSLSGDELCRDLNSLSDHLNSPSSSLRTVESNLRSWNLMSPVLMRTPESSSNSPISITPAKSSPAPKPMRTPSSSSGSLNDTSAPSSGFVRPSGPVRRKHSQAQANIPKQGSKPSTANGPERSRLWLSRCFLACIIAAGNQYDLLSQALDAAQQEFEKLARSNDSQLLTAQIVLISILHSHGQLDMAGRLIDQAFRILERHYKDQPAFLSVAHFFRLGARQELAKSSMETSTLIKAHESICSTFGPTSAHALAALYSLGFFQIIRKDYQLAEANLRNLFALAAATLDPCHLITTASLTALARVLTYLNRPHEAITLLNDATERDTIALGYSHPLRLDHRRRLANTYRDLGEKLQLVESIYREVFEARREMLGNDHPYTRGILQTLMDFLRERDRESEAQELEEQFPLGRGGQGFHVSVIRSY